MKLDTYHNLYKDLERALEDQVLKFTPNHEIAQVYQYALLPAGKLFRPLLAIMLAEDLSVENPTAKPFINFAMALEIHHAYSLIHDDLPCMDDDDYRRGRESTHKKFGQWRAVLTGDALISESFRCILETNHKRSALLAKIFARAMGAKGLVHGQVLDLEDKNHSFEKTKQIHTLKTARLIQVSLLGAAILSSKNNWKSLAVASWRLGESLGLIFQFLDDLSELTDDILNEHEQTINPWLRWPMESKDCLKDNLVRTKIALEKLEAINLKQLILSYLKTMEEKLLSNEQVITKHLKEPKILRDCLPIVL